MENGVGNAKGLPVEKAKYNLPVTLGYQTKYYTE
ncbi:hypothetical protein ES703_97963 [subsurface metagenome]